MSANRSALITGITGQDGSFLAELLLDQGYEVVGASREGPGAPLGCSEHLRERISVVRGELLDGDGLRRLIGDVAPDELYHLAAPSLVPASWRSPSQTMEAIAGSCGAVLEGVRDLCPETRVFVAASAAMFGESGESPQNEETRCRPQTPYAVAKLAAHQLVGLMRERDGIHVSSGIVFNHESERRPEEFVTRRITRAAVAIAAGLADELTLGSLDAVRDWSFAGDVMRGAWLMLQQERGGDYVLASGVGRTVREFAATAFAGVGLEAERYLRVDEALVRPRESTPSVGDPSRARDLLDWHPQVSFEQLVERMLAADRQALEAPSA